MKQYRMSNYFTYVFIFLVSYLIGYGVVKVIPDIVKVLAKW